MNSDRIKKFLPTMEWRKSKTPTGLAAMVITDRGFRSVEVGLDGDLLYQLVHLSYPDTDYKTSIMLVVSQIVGPSIGHSWADCFDEDGDFDYQAFKKLARSIGDTMSVGYTDNGNVVAGSVT